MEISIRTQPAAAAVSKFDLDDALEVWRANLDESQKTSLLEGTCRVWAI